MVPIVAMLPDIVTSAARVVVDVWKLLQIHNPPPYLTTSLSLYLVVLACT